MDWFPFCKTLYQLNADITNYVTLKAITTEQYKQITGQDYDTATEPQSA